MKSESDHSKKFPWRASLVLLFTVVFAGYYFVTKHELPQSAEPADKKAGKGDKRGKDMTTVSMETVKLADVPVYLRGLGTVIALRTVTVKSRVDGELLRILYKEGSMVKEGDLLAEIDSRSIQIQLMQMEGQLQRDEALLKNAELDLQRYKTLLAQDSIAAQQVATQESLVKQYQGVVTSDKAQVANAKLQLSYSKITAPISGRLGLCLVDQGNLIKAADAQGLAVITEVQPISVMFTLPEDILPALNQRLNSGKTLTVEAFDRSGKNKLAEGQLTAVDNQIDLTTGTVKLKSQFANTDNALFVNQFVNVRMLIDTLHSVPVIPNTAVQNGERGSFVYVLKDDQTVAVRTVKLGAVDGDKVAVLEGITEKEQVIIDGTDKLRDGAKVRLAGAEKTESSDKSEKTNKHRSHIP
jgi:membrane fusion protein, multidrug efflux system